MLTVILDRKHYFEVDEKPFQEVCYWVYDIQNPQRICGVLHL